MDSNIAKSLIGLYNCIWLSETLLLERGESNSGIDIYDESHRIGVELKSKDRFYKPRNFAVKNAQVRLYPRENPDSTLYWAFMLYSSKKRPQKITSKDKLEELLHEREVWFLPWEWMRKYPVCRGEGEDYRYPPLRDFPKNGYFRIQDVDGGVFHIPKGTIIDKRVKNLEKERNKRRIAEAENVAAGVPF